MSAKSFSLALLMLSLDVAFGKPDLFTSCKISAEALVLTNLRRPKLARFADMAQMTENGGLGVSASELLSLLASLKK